MPNKLVFTSGGDIENASTSRAVTEMLLQSHEGVLRLFLVWPRKLDARFGTLRAHGAFLISAQLKHGEISGVKIVSEKGTPCVVTNPWPGRTVTVVRMGLAAETVIGDRFTIKTSPGETVELRGNCMRKTTLPWRPLWFLPPPASDLWWSADHPRIHADVALAILFRRRA